MCITIIQSTSCEMLTGLLCDFCIEFVIAIHNSNITFGSVVLAAEMIMNFLYMRGLCFVSDITTCSGRDITTSSRRDITTCSGRDITTSSGYDTPNPGRDITTTCSCHTFEILFSHRLQIKLIRKSNKVNTIDYNERIDSVC